MSVVASIAVTHWYFAPDTWGEDVGVLSSSDPTLVVLYRLVWLDGLIVAALCLALILRHRQMRLIERAAQALETRVKVAMSPFPFTETTPRGSQTNASRINS